MGLPNQVNLTKSTYPQRGCKQWHCYVLSHGRTFHLRTLLGCKQKRALQFCLTAARTSWQGVIESILLNEAQRDDPSK
eukprot:461801-Amphidinium_carterae.1